MKKCDYCKEEAELIEYKGYKLCKICIDWFIKHPERKLFQGRRK